ncbi:MAG TPA: hypothetical protein VFT98_13710 [Myxococcota bacterium]|nr:hypothetical protein [Myxococcota bacterium]
MQDSVETGERARRYVLASGALLFVLLTAQLLALDPLLEAIGRPILGWLALALALAVHTRALHDRYRNTDEIQETLAALALSAAVFARYYGGVGSTARESAPA